MTEAPGEKAARLLTEFRGRLGEMGLNARGDTAAEALRDSVAALGLGLEKRLKRELERSGEKGTPLPGPEPAATVKALLLRLLESLKGDGAVTDDTALKAASTFREGMSEAVDYLNGLVLSGEVERGKGGDSVLNAEWIALSEGQPTLVRLGVAVRREKGENKPIDSNNVRFGVMVDTSRLGRVSALFDVNRGRLSGRIGVTRPDFAEFVKGNLDRLEKGLEKAGYNVVNLVCMADRAPVEDGWPDWLVGDTSDSVQMFDVVV